MIARPGIDGANAAKTECCCPRSCRPGLVLRCGSRECLIRGSCTASSDDVRRSVKVRVRLLHSGGHRCPNATAALPTTISVCLKGIHDPFTTLGLSNATAILWIFLPLNKWRVSEAKNSHCKVHMDNFAPSKTNYPHSTP